MADRSASGEKTAGRTVDIDRKPWSSPRMRVLKAHAAENGPTFPTADGIEGQS
jgi:hypothetical protein